MTSTAIILRLVDRGGAGGFLLQSIGWIYARKDLQEFEETHWLCKPWVSITHPI